MIYAVRANSPTFREIEFGRYTNVILADRTKQSTRLDSRNGLGKSTLLEIIHFCLGGSFDKKSALASERVRDWTFSLELDLSGVRATVERSVAHPNEVLLRADSPDELTLPVDAFGRIGVSVPEWNRFLGSKLLGIDDPEHLSGERPKYRPTFRGIISYFIRRGRGGFLSPFSNHPKQAEWDRQICNAFLLGLDWQDAREWQVLKDRQKEIEAFQKAAATGFARGFFGSLGELEASKVRLEGALHQFEAALASFQVHPQYREIERRANELTQDLHQLTNENVTDTQILDSYRSTIHEEVDPSTEDLAVLYDEAGVVLPTAIRRRLDEVQEFHNRVIENRRAFLAEEITRIERTLASRAEKIREFSDERATLLNVLRTHGALEEYVRLQEQHTQVVQQFRDITGRIEALRKLQRERAELRIAIETLRHRAQLNYDARREQRDRAIGLFNANSEALYDAPGNLVIDVTPTGFRYDVEIERSKSQGIENMKIFCYDLAIAEMWASSDHSPGVLIHDSTIFDGVDERQVARALELAAQRSAAAGFQYICTMNSDAVPWSEFSTDFSLEEHVRLRLTDAEESGSLLGIRF
jgi:uncharacterized protein YydD (DUF2326 family)